MSSNSCKSDTSTISIAATLLYPSDPFYCHCQSGGGGTKKFALRVNNTRIIFIELDNPTGS